MTGCWPSWHDEHPVTSDIDQAKQALRERVWALLDDQGTVQPPGAAGHIPSFVGAKQAAEQLAGLPEWQNAQVIKANPDRAQLPARVLALQAGKLLYIAVPNLATLQPFYRLDPAALTAPFEQAVSNQGAAQTAERVSVEAMRPVDLIICGSVAVNRQGARIGKGAGYSDIEVALLMEAGLVGEETVIATTVHDLQVLDELLPETEHDFSVDLIATPTEVISCGRPWRPAGVYWGHLSAEKIAAIPALAERKTHLGGEDRG